MPVTAAERAAGSAPGVPRSRDEAAAADAADPLAGRRADFGELAERPIYLDGNSLGRPTAAAPAAVATLLEEWRTRLVGGWEDWIDLPGVVGDRIAGLVGAAAGQVVVSDSTTVNLYKLAAAAVAARPGRPVVVADAHDFPTVLYVLQGLVAERGLELRLVDSDPVGGIDPADLAAAVGPDVALVCLSGVNYRSGARLDLAAAAELAHGAGALVCWDLSHAAGAVPVFLDADGADLAVGCTYKYLNAGPGAPAWLYVRSGLQSQLRQPIWGWWGQSDQFAMDATYAPVEGIGRFLTGTPSVLGLAGIAAGIAPVLAAGMPALWAKTERLTALATERVRARLVPLGAALASPADPARRGAHVAVAHPHALGLCRLAIDRGAVVADFRPPDVVRLAPVPVSTRYVDVWDAVEDLAALLGDPAVAAPVPVRRVT